MRKRLLPIVLLVACVSARASAQGTASGRIEGVAADSLHHGALGGATIVATPAQPGDTVFHSAIADSLGRFAIGGLLPGAYVLTVDHASIDSSGIGAPPVTVTLRGADTARVTLAVPSTAALRRALCADALVDSTVGVMLGTVRRVDGRALVDGTVVFSWADFEVQRARTVQPRQLTASVRTDSSGVYRACGLPVQRSLFVQAQGEPGAQSGIIEEQIGEAGVLRRDLRISALADSPATRAVVRAAGSAAAASTSGVTVVGHVMSASGDAIPSATVTLLGTTLSATTNEGGQFRLLDAPTGTQGLRVIALGYLPQVQRIEIGRDGTSALVQLENAAVVLDSMRIIAQRSRPPVNPVQSGFEHRRHNGIGTFLTAQQIAATHAEVVTDIMRHLAGVRLATPRGSGSEIVVSNRGITSLLGSPTICPLDVFLDGTRVTPADINMVAPSALHGMEVHSVATAPPQYKVGNCGAVFLWTR